MTKVPQVITWTLSGEEMVSIVCTTRHVHVPRSTNIIGNNEVKSILVLNMVLKIPIKQQSPEQYSTNKLSERF